MRNALLAAVWIAHGLMVVTLLANLWYLRRSRRRAATGTGQPAVCVLIPARNEAANLRRLLPSLLAQRYPRFGVIVYDDGSEDETADVAAGFGDPRVRVVQGHGPPPGWVGKVHALYQATRDATGELYLFLDADTELADPEALARMVARHQALPAPCVLTGLPRFAGGGLLLVSGIPHALMVSLPLSLVPHLRLRALGALNGQVWMIRRDLYHELEPHAAHQNEVLEDLKIGRWLRARGVVPWFSDLRDVLTVRMYDTTADAWRGFRKNAYLVMGGRPVTFALWWAWFAGVTIVAPLLLPLLLVPLWGGRLLADRYARFPWWVTAAAPLSFLLWAVLQLDSAVSHRTGRVRWKGRLVGSTGQ